MRTLVLAFLLAAGCGSASSSVDDLGSTEQDLGADDLRKADFSGNARDCRVTGCRAFSSTCSTAACVCLPLAADEPDPRCDATTVSCLVDPCDGKVAVCNKLTRACEIQTR